MSTGNCVIFQCQNPPVSGGVLCAAHLLDQEGREPVAVGPMQASSPQLSPAPAPPDLAGMVAEYDFAIQQWILKPRDDVLPEEHRNRMVRIRALVRELMKEVGIDEAGRQ